MTINTPGRGWDDSNLHTLDSVNQSTSSEIWRTISQEYTITSYLGENPDKEELIAAIKSAIELIKKEDIYASWSEWEIYRIKIADTKGNTRDLLVAKKRFDNDPDNEYTLHDRIWKLVQNWDPVKVPKLLGRFSHDGDDYIVMDFIKWKTLYHKIAEWIIEAKAEQIEASATWKSEMEKNVAQQQANNLRNRIKSAKSDSDVDHIFLEWYEYDSKKADDAFYRERGKIKIFWSEEWEKYRLALRNFIKKIHENWFYHRDLHEKNIIFWDDGKIYVIDFWKSIFIDSKKWKLSKKDIYEEQVWEMIWSYSEDEDLIWQIKWLTKEKQDEENEILSNEAKERAKELKKGSMIVEIIDFDKIKSKKIKNMIKKQFWWIDQLKRQLSKEEKWEHTVDSFLDVDDNDFIISLFSMTEENADLLVNLSIPNREKQILDKIKNIRYTKLWEKSRIDLFGSVDWSIDVKFLQEVLNKMRNKKGYEEIYKDKRLDFLRELKPMLDNAKILVKMKEILFCVEDIRNAVE